MAENAKKYFSDHSQICFIPSFLLREEYMEWMQTAELVLLPYLGKDYARRTSGIFVEAVSVGAIPVTTKGTWMAYELGKFNLTELIFDWTEVDLLDRLCILPKNQKILQKLQVMRAYYQSFHCEKGFAATLQRLFTHS
jgi:hypothetical protein